MPDARTLMLLRLWTLVFPTSDFRHPVGTPMAVLCTEFLACCPVRSSRDAALALLLCSIVYTVSTVQ